MTTPTPTPHRNPVVSGPRPAARPTAQLALATVAALLATGALAGCSGKSTSTSTETTTTGPSVAATLPSEPSFKGTPAGALVDVRVVDCPTDSGTQTAKLELTNSTKKARDYSVMVIWLVNGSGTPLGSGLVKVDDAAPGKKQELNVKAKVLAKADKCVLNVKAGTLK